MSTRYQYFKQLAARSGMDVGAIIEIEAAMADRIGEKPGRQALAEAVYKAADAETQKEHK